METNQERIPFEQLFVKLSERIDHLLLTLQTTYDQALFGLIHEDRKALDASDQSIKKLVAMNEDLQYELFGSIKRIEEKDSEGSRLFLYVFDLEQDIVQSAELIARASNKHVNNMLSPLHVNQVQVLKQIRHSVHGYLNNVRTFMLGSEEIGVRDTSTAKK